MQAPKLKRFTNFKFLIIILNVCLVFITYGKVYLSKPLAAIEYTSKLSDAFRESAKKIVIYTTFFHRPWPRTNVTDLRLRRCLETKCVFSFNKSEAEDADLVFFQGDDIEEFPKTRQPHQRYVWMTREGPVRPYLKFGKENVFNWTLTYHRDSDIFVPYGFLRLLEEEDHTHLHQPQLLDKGGAAYQNYIQDLKNNITLLDDPQKDWSSFLSRNKTVVWMVSRCESWSGREYYVEELQKYIDVDIYGKCGDFDCQKEREKCYEDVLAPNFLFYLAFENQLSFDYATEKLWFSLKYGMVPVVLGGSNYDDFLPPHSYINAYELTPKELAEKMNSLASSPHEYAKYHLWRKYWAVVIPEFHCALCYKLHNNHSASVVKNVGKWWNETGNTKEAYHV